MRHRRRGQRGQTLVLFTLFLVVLLGIAGLAIDVSMSYAQARMQHAVSDASALAGAQDLQDPGSRTVTAADRTRARDHALQILEDQLGGTASCDTSADFTACPLAGTPYVVSVKTPAPSCMSGGCTVDAYHAVQVTIDYPQFPLGFSRIFGIESYNIERTSVAGMRFSAQYAIVTLRGACPNPHQPLDPCAQDLNLNGTNVLLNVLTGDIGSNTTVVMNSSSQVCLAPGYLIYHIDPNLSPWNTCRLTGTVPGGQVNSDYIPDPGYMYPAKPTAASTIYATQSQGEDPTCTGVPASIVTTYHPTCYKPGVYTSVFNVSTGGGPSVAYLTNTASAGGAYFFDRGAKINGTLFGGLVSGQSGVVIVTPWQQTFNANNAVMIQINRGDLSCTQDTCRATPARDYTGTLVQTPAVPTPMVISMEVTKVVPSCFDGSGLPLCNGSTNTGSNTLSLAGNSSLYIAGVVYAPSDNVKVNANWTATDGTISQLITWTTTYSGGATLNQSYPGDQVPGTLRLDSACTTSTTPCTP